jgi:hypothetical protein
LLPKKIIGCNAHSHRWRNYNNFSFFEGVNNLNVAEGEIAKRRSIEKSGQFLIFNLISDDEKLMAEAAIDEAVEANKMAEWVIQQALEKLCLAKKAHFLYKRVAKANGSPEPDLPAKLKNLIDAAKYSYGEVIGTCVNGRPLHNCGCQPRPGSECPRAQWFEYNP